MNKVLIDTNVLIYSIDEDSEFFDLSRKVLLDENNENYTTSKNLSEFISVVTRIPNNSISIEEAVSIVDEFTSFIKIIYPNEESFLTFQELLLKYKPTGIKIHDFEIISIALANNINSIFTFNEKDFEKVSEIKLLK